MNLLTRLSAASTALVTASLLLGTGSAGAAQPSPPQQHAPSTQQIPFTKATVTAAHKPGTYRVSWQAPGVGQVRIEADGHTVALGGSRGKVTVSGLPRDADRQWFDLVPERGGSLHLADRLIDLEGTANFRDAGGYRTADGRWVKMGEIYRSDALDKLTEDDLATLERLDIDVDYDLRQESERSEAPDRVPERTEYVVADVLGNSGAFTEMPTTAEEAADLMIQGEKTMVSSESAKAAYSSVFGGIVDGDSALYHCTAGKDRTGWASAVLLTVLGVPRETVMTDYLASNDYREEANAAALAQMPAEQAEVYRPMLDVRSAYLNSGFDEVREEFGSFRAYQKRALGLDAKDVRRLERALLVG